MSIVERDGTMLIKRLSGMIAAMVLLFGISGVLTTASAVGFDRTLNSTFKVTCPTCSPGRNTVSPQNSGDNGSTESCNAQYLGVIYDLMLGARDIPGFDDWVAEQWQAYFINEGDKLFVETDVDSCFHSSQRGKYHAKVEEIINQAEAAASAAAAE